MTGEKNTDEQHGKANGRVVDQVYFNPTDQCWRIVHQGQVLPTDWPTREAAEAHLTHLRRTAP